jgi:hypothetical protein
MNILRLHQLSIDFIDHERALFDIKIRQTLFDIKIRQEIIVAPMRDYIQNWLKNALTKTTQRDQEEVVATGHGIPMKEITKVNLARK